MLSSPRVEALVREQDRELSDVLRARGYRVTPQRLLINRALRELGRHAPAEEVRDAVGHHLPQMSLPTVYATLDLLHDLGLVRRVAVGGRPVLYDPRAENHDHVVCTACGRVEDLDVSVEASAAVEAARRRGFDAHEVAVVVSGRCASCDRDRAGS